MLDKNSKTVRMKDKVFAHKDVIGYCLISLALALNLLEFFYAVSPGVKVLVSYESLLLLVILLLFIWVIKKEKETLKARDEFIGMASHELKTPLTAIKMQADILNKNVSDPSMKRMVENILIACGRMTNLINNLLDATKVRLNRFTVYKTTTDIVPIIKDITRQLEVRDIKLETPDSIIGQFDKDRLSQIYENVLMNAIKYGQGNPVRISITSHDDVLEIQVSDSGIGISSEEKRVIFNPYTRGGRAMNIEGSGIGLHIAREIAKAHGGTIAVESEIGRGSVFIIKIPLK